MRPKGQPVGLVAAADQHREDRPRHRRQRRKAASRSAASRAGVTRWTAPRVTTTRGPRSRSCSGTIERSNSPRPTAGSWICAATVRPPLARRIASAGIAALRPQAITKSGQGGVEAGAACRPAHRAVPATAAAADSSTGSGSQAAFRQRRNRLLRPGRSPGSPFPPCRRARPSRSDRIAIGRVYGNGPGRGKARPSTRNKIARAARAFL